jgi:hypothetical protein
LNTAVWPALMEAEVDPPGAGATVIAWLALPPTLMV